jgi:iron(III) transport system permease protein
VKQPRWLQITIFLVFTIIVLLPILFMLFGSIWADGQLSLSSYRELLFDKRQIGLIKNSFGLSFGATLLSLAIGVPLAFLSAKTNLWGRKIVGVVYFIPLLIPPYIHAIVWAHLFSNNGLVNQWIAQLFSLKETPFDIYGLPGAIFVMTLAYFPFVILLTVSGLSSTNRGMEEASLLHHGPWQTIKGITLPLVAPHILCGALFVFIFSVINFGVPDILRLRVYPLEVFIQFTAYYNEKAAMALSLPLVGIALLLVALQKWYMKDRSYVNLASGFEGTKRYHLGRLQWFACIFAFGVLFLSVVMPMAVLLKMAGPISTYLKVLETSKTQIGYSIVLALLGGFFMVCLAFFISCFIERTDGRAKTVVEFATLIPFAIPATVLGIGMIKVWNRPITDAIYGSSFIIILGYVAHFIPFTNRVVYSALKQVSPRLEEAGFLITNNWIMVIWKIVLPLMVPGLLAAFFIGFILSLGELGTTLLIMPPGMTTLPVKIYNFMHYGAEQMVAALCLVLIGIILIFSGTFYLAYKKVTKTD